MKNILHIITGSATCLNVGIITAVLYRQMPDIANRNIVVALFANIIILLAMLMSELRQRDL